MAVIKHISIKNSSYTSAIEYLTYKHDEFTNKPILDDKGRPIPRDEYLIEGINCTPRSYGMECTAVNQHFGKNQNRREIKAHHYILSFDLRDRDENGLTPDKAQELDMNFARKYFPGHQIIVCTHPDGHNSAGNIHVHIVLNSVRAFDVERQEFMERPGDAMAGHKHHVTKDYLEFLKQQTMTMCQEQSLNQVDLLRPAKVRITDREYWAQRRGQAELDRKSVENKEATTPIPEKFETDKGYLRRVITTTMQDSNSYEEFQKKLFENYTISVHESRKKISYLLPDKTKPIRGSKLGTDFEKEFILRYISTHSRSASKTKTSEKQLGKIADISSNEKAKQSRAYANAIKKSNLQKMADTVAFFQEHGFSIDELPELLSSTSSDFEAKRSALKTTEDELHKLNPIIQATRQYYKTRKVHTEYLHAKNKKNFREEHYSDLAIYDAAMKELKEYYGAEKFKPLKGLTAKRSELVALKNEQYEDFCFVRSKYRELQTLSANTNVILQSQTTIPLDSNIRS